jgi:hypothetical protein
MCVVNGKFGIETKATLLTLIQCSSVDPINTGIGYSVLR